MKEVFGNSRPFKAAVRAGLVLGPLTSASVVAVALFEDRTPTWSDALLGGVVMGLLIPLLALSTMLFSVHVEEGLISQRVCRFWRLSQGRVEDLRRVEFGCGWTAARLLFKDGSCVSLPMADTRELQALCVCLMESRPDFGNYIFGPRVARVEKVVQAFRAASTNTPQVVERKRHDRAEPGVATRMMPWGGLRRTARAA